MSKIRRFVVTAGTYFLGNVLSKLITFFLIPLYTNLLDPSPYGNVDLAMTLITFFVAVAFFQVWDGMFRFAFDCKDDDGKYNLISNSLGVYVACLPLYCAFFFVANYYLGFLYWQFALAYGLVYGLQYIYSFSARAFMNNRLFVFSGVANTFAAAATNVVLIAFLNYGVVSLYIAQICGCFVQVAIIETRLHTIRHFNLHEIRLSVIKPLLKFSIPLCIATVSYWLLSGYSKLVINQALGSYENGIFAIASSLANAATLAISVFQFAWNETAYLLANEEGRLETYQKCINLLYLTVSFGYAIICVLLKVFFPLLVGSEYQSAAAVVPVLMLGVSVNAIASFLGTLFMAEKKTIDIIISVSCAAVVNLALAWFAAEQYGIMGTVVVLSISFCILLVVRQIQLRVRIGVKMSLTACSGFPLVVFAFLLYSYVDSVVILVLFAAATALAYLFITSRLFDIKFIKRRVE